MLFSRWIAPALIALVVGCVPLTPEKTARAPEKANSTVLFSITLSTAAALDAEPAGLIVNVDAQQRAMTKQFAFTPNSRIPGHHTTFLVRLDLPPGRYSLARFSAIAADGTPIAQFDVVPNMAFDMRPKGTDYLGHIELSHPRAAAAAGSTPDTSNLVIADAYEDELPNFVHAWPALRGRAVGRAAHSGATQIPVQAQTAASADAVARSDTGSKGAVAMPRLDSSAAAGLPSNAQRAFRYFLHGSYPRAFAVTASGSYTGMAFGGTDVIGRALKNCQHAQPAEQHRSCRLFALDDTLLSSLQGAPGPMRVNR